MSEPFNSRSSQRGKQHEPLLHRGNHNQSANSSQGSRMRIVQRKEFDPELNYNTVTSTASHDSSEGFLTPPYLGSILRFGSDAADPKDRPYVCIPPDATADDIANFIAYSWHRRTPKIVLSIICEPHYFRQWKNERALDDFQKGVTEAANLTEMWILTDGLDCGMGKIIGDAMAEEMDRRKSQSMESIQVKSFLTEQKLPRLTIMGMMCKSQISYGRLLDGLNAHERAQSIENIGRRGPMSEKFELNPDHTHFMILEDSDLEMLTALRYNLEVRFQRPVGRARRYRRTPSSSTTLGGTASETEVGEAMAREDNMTPVIGLMVQGGPLDLDHVLGLLKKKIPVIVLRGFGFTADLIAFAYVAQQSTKSDEEAQMYMKPELMKKVVETFPEFRSDELARNAFRDKILECVSYAKQDDQTFLTIVDMDARDTNLKNLSKYILMALFKSTRAKKLGRRWREQIQRDLQLCLDWNRCDLAKSMIYHKYDWTRIKVEDHIFHQALQIRNRMEFVELFLEKGFEVHRYLNHKRLHHLFETALDKEFFLSVCIEGVLGKTVTPNTPLMRNFVEDENCELNQLLFNVTGLQKLVNPYELSMNSLGTYISNKPVAERRAVNALIYWAVFTYRPLLAKVFWQRTEDPMAMAIVISMLYHRLAKKYCKDIDIKRKIKETAVEFGKMAVTLLDLCYKDSSVHAFQALNKKLPDFNNRTVVELANLARNKHFIAHQSCQKALIQRWYGNLQVRELTWGVITLPVWLKLYLSVFLFFPMFIYISFDLKEEPKKKEDNPDEDEDDYAADDAMLLRPLSMHENKHKRKKKHTVQVQFKNLIDRGATSWSLPVWKQVYYLWSAPITKFWVNQLFYVLFLITFSITVLWPSCGNFYLNIAVFIWTGCIWMELVRRCYVKKTRYPEVTVFWTCVELSLVLLFLFVLFLFRILPLFVHYVDYMTTKFLMSLALIFFYYRTLAVFLPISPTLGPMLISFQRMVRKDLFTWLRVFVIIMVSGGVTIQATLYPTAPIALKGTGRYFARAFFALFLTQIDDLNGRPDCDALYDNVTSNYCYASIATPSGAGPMDDKLAPCPYAEWYGYVILVQYFLIVKLVLTTILFALFSVTLANVDRVAIEIWKFQRYGLMVDFETSLRLPAPLTLISYLCMLIQLIFRLLKRMCIQCAGCSKQCKACRKLVDRMDSGTSKIQILKVRQSKDYNYWKNCVNTFVQQEAEHNAEQERSKSNSERLIQVMDEMQMMQDSQNRLTDRLVLVERGVTQCGLMLEQMKHMIEKLDPKAQGLKAPTVLIHVSARQSPYPGTKIMRYPVFDKHVQWQVPYDTYDPSYYTKPILEFSEDVQKFVDLDLLELRKMQEERNLLTQEEQEALEPLPLFEPMWNAATTMTLDDGSVAEINRVSWITMDGQTVRYPLDAMGLPLNPMGRTGLRGRGKLCRWGPNHRILAVITRWKRKHKSKVPSEDFIVVDGKRVLEFLVVTRPDMPEFSLPGGSVFGKTSAYSVLCEEFMLSVLCENEVEGSSQLNEEDMVNYFAKFANPRGSDFTAQSLYRGYFDDAANTDNAWREAEVWNFHYHKGNIFNEVIPEKTNSAWRDISPHMRLYGNQDTIVMEAARIHESYF